jgi:hypothetical protein
MPLTTDTDVNVRRALASRQRLHAALERALARDGSADVGLALASSRWDIDGEALEILKAVEKIRAQSASLRVRK